MKIRRIRRRRKGALSYWKYKAISEAKRVARLAGKCERCGNTNNLHGSHIIPLSSSSLIGAEPYNIIALCYHCHLNWWHKHPLEVRPWFDSKWPGRFKELEAMVMEARNNKPTADDWKSKYEKLVAIN